MMLILQGTPKSCHHPGRQCQQENWRGSTERHVLQVETVDNRGLVQMDTITVPSLASFMDKVGKVVNLPVRAWVNTGRVAYAYEEKRLKRPFKGIPGHVLASFPSHVLGVWLFSAFQGERLHYRCRFPVIGGGWRRRDAGREKAPVRCLIT